MSKWWIISLFTLLILAVTVVIWRAEKRGGFCYEQSAAQTTVNAFTPPLVVESPPDKQSTRQEANKPPSTSENYLCSLIVPANLPTIYLVLIGIGGVFVAIGTLTTIEKQSEAAVKSVELVKAKERARLAIDFKPFVWENKVSTNSTTRVIQFVISIYGATAARILDSGLVSGIALRGQEQEPELGSAVLFPIVNLPKLLLPNTPPL
jgi:hypothetical protein